MIETSTIAQNEIPREEVLSTLACELTKTQQAYNLEMDGHRKVGPEAAAYLQKQQDLISEAHLTENEAIQLMGGYASNPIREAVARNISQVNNLSMRIIEMVSAMGLDHLLPQQLEQLYGKVNVADEELSQYIYTSLTKPPFSNLVKSKSLIKNSDNFRYPPKSEMFTSLIHVNSDTALDLLAKYPREIAQHVQLSEYFDLSLSRNSKKAIELYYLFGLSESEVIRRAKDKYHFDALADNIYYFSSEKQQEIIEFIHAEPRTVLELLHTDLPINHEAIIQHRRLDSQQKLAYIYELRPGEQAKQEFKSTLLIESPEQLVYVMDAFDDLTADDIDELMKSDGFFFNLHKIPGWDRSSFRSLIINKLQNRFVERFDDEQRKSLYLTYMEYGEIEGLLRLTAIDKQKPPFEESAISEFVLNQLTTALKAKNFLTAQLYIRWAMHNEIELPLLPLTIEEIEERAELEQVRREHTQPKREALVPVDIQNTLMHLHLTERLFDEMNKLDHALEHTSGFSSNGLANEPQELAFRNQAQLNYVKQELAGYIGEHFEQIRKYMVTAVVSELRSQTQRGMTVMTSKRIIETGTDEEIRIFLNKAITKFNHAQDMKGALHGGKVWKKIAQLAAHQWQNPSDSPLTEKIRLADNAFDLEHNFGNIFDKDPRIKKFRRLETLYELRFSTTTDFERLIEEALEKNIFDETEAKTYRNLYARIHEIGSTAKRAKGYD